MKRGGTRHLKTRRLAENLGISTAHAVGLLEMLFHLTYEQAPTGDISEFTPSELARELTWECDGDSMHTALVTSGWLDVDGDLTLVHGWADHCDDSTHMKLARSGRLFADGSRPRTTRLSSKERARIEKLLETAETQRQRDVCAQQAHAVRTAIPSHPIPSPPIDDGPVRMSCAQPAHGVRTDIYRGDGDPDGISQEGHDALLKLMAPPWGFGHEKALKVVVDTGCTGKTLDEWKRFRRKHGGPAAIYFVRMYRTPGEIPPEDHPDKQRNAKGRRSDFTRDGKFDYLKNEGGAT